jgi:nucleotide-binding universal stress UspA family protein
MYKAILVPLDGSPLAAQALPTAARIARATGAALHLVHVHVAASPDPISIEGMPVVDENLRSLAAEHEQVYLERAAATVAGDELRPIVSRLQGPVVQALTSYARDIQAGLIIMTTHGRSGFDHLWLGSVAEALVRVTGTPLLMLRPDASGSITERPFANVLAPLDGSPLAEEILPHAVALAALDGGGVTLLRVVDSLNIPAAMPFHERFRKDETALAQERAAADQYLQRVAADLAPTQVATSMRTADQPEEAIVTAAAELGADLVAMTTHGRSALTRSPISSVTDKVLRGVPRPMLILRPAMHHAD